MHILFGSLVLATGMAQAAKAPPPLPGWEGAADPPAVRVEWPATPKPIPVPPVYYPDVTFSQPGRRFVAVGKNSADKETRAVLDLTTGAKVGELAGKLPLSPPYALSEDGTRFVAGKVLTHDGPIYVYDVKSGKLLTEIATPTKPSVLAFLGADRLVGLVRGTVTAYELPSGKTLWEVPLAQRSVGPGPSVGSGLMAVSPGRQFVAVIVGAEVRLLRADTGKFAGALSILIPPAVRAGSSVGATTLAFSPDGSRLTVLVGTTAGNRAYTWDMRTGREAGYVPVPHHSARGYNAPDSLTWSGDGSTWLLDDDRLIDPGTGKMLWRVPKNNVRSNLRLLVGPHLLLDLDLSRVQPGKPPVELRFEPIALPKDRIEAARAAVRDGGLAVEGWLPKAAEVNSTAAVPSRLPEPGSVAWQVVADPGPEPPAPDGPISLPFPYEQIASWHITKAAVFDLAEHDRLRPDEDRPRTVVRLDLPSGKETGRVELPPGVRLLSVSLDAAWAVSADTGEGRRIDVWSLDTGKHVAGWRPDPDNRDDRARVLVAFVPAADRVLTVTAGGQAALWMLPAVAPVYRLHLDRFDGRRVSPDGKYLIGVQGSSVRLVEVATGKPAGDLALPGKPWVSDELDRPGHNHGGPQLVIRPDGRDLTVIMNEYGPPRTTIVRYDLIAGKPVVAVRVNPHSSPSELLGYVNPDQVMTERGVMDLRLGESVFSFPSGGIPRFAEPYCRGGYRGWYLTTRPNSAGGHAAALTAADFTPALVEVEKLLSGPDRALRPGTKVAVAVACEGAAAKAGEAALRKAAEKLAAERGWVVAEPADVVIRLSGKEVGLENVPPVLVSAVVARPRPEVIPRRPVERVEGKVKAADIQATASVEFRGQQVWSNTAHVAHWRTRTDTGLRVPSQDADLTAAHRARLWEDVPGYLNLGMTPRTLIKRGSQYAPLPLAVWLNADGAALTPPGVPAPAR